LPHLDCHVSSSTFALRAGVSTFDLSRFMGASLTILGLSSELLAKPDSAGDPAAVITLLCLAGFIVSFAATTLDSAVRLMRYIIGELGMEYKVPQLGRRHVATGLAVGMTALLVLLPDGGRGLGSGGYLLWPLFGTSNQLLAGITLMLISLWLYKLNRNPLPTLVPNASSAALTAFSSVRWPKAGVAVANRMAVTLTDRSMFIPFGLVCPLCLSPPI
jgi:carbon starvation protein CstA